MSADALMDSILMRSALISPSLGARPWSTQEDTFIRANLGYLTDSEIGSALGRTEVAVHIRWDRELGLPGPSKATNVVTAHQAARMLGLDGHTTCGWVDMGLLPGRIMAGGRNIRLIERETLRRWAANPMHWIYFDPEGVVDPELKRLLELRQARWGDAWWTARQVADYHGVDVGNVNNWIKQRRLPAMQAQYSVSGRHLDRRWSYWFVLRSVATHPNLVFWTHSNRKPRFTARAEVWILRARDELGWSFDAIARSVGKTHETIRNHYNRLKGQTR